MVDGKSPGGTFRGNVPIPTTQTSSPAAKMDSGGSADGWRSGLAHGRHQPRSADWKQRQRAGSRAAYWHVPQVQGLHRRSTSSNPSRHHTHIPYAGMWTFPLCLVSTITFPLFRSRFGVIVLPLPESVILFPLPFREQATELDGNHFP